MAILKNKIPLLLFLASALVISLANSCKKDNSGSLSSLITGGYWQLAAVYRTSTKGDSTHTDTLNTTCNLAQKFTFNPNGTCTYSNYDCNGTQPVASGKWSISSDKHFLNSDITCKDANGNNIQPFTNAQIYNLGQYSLVLLTGDLGQYYPPNVRHTQMRYSFVRQKTP